MWNLVMLQPLSEHNTPDSFYPSWQINGSPAKCLTYGIEMCASNDYSDLLKNLIFECLYEMPEHRPTAGELKKAVVLGCQFAESAAVALGQPGGEPWEDFKMPEPIDVQPQPPAQGAQLPRAARTQGSVQSASAQFQRAHAQVAQTQAAQNQANQWSQNQTQQVQDQAAPNQVDQRPQEQTQPAQQNTPSAIQPGSAGAIVSRPAANPQSTPQPPAANAEYLIIIIHHLSDVSTLYEVKTYAFRNREVFTVTTIAELKSLLRHHDCQLQPQNMHLQICPSPDFPRVSLDDDTRTLAYYSLDDPDQGYNLNLFETADPIPEGNPPGAIAYHVRFRMRSGQYANQDFLLRGLGSTYTVDRIMGLLERKCGIAPDRQQWLMPVINFDSTLRNYMLEDGDIIEVWDAADGLSP